MKNKALIGGIVALVIIFLIVGFCLLSGRLYYWVVEKGSEIIEKTNNSNVNTNPQNLPPSQQPINAEQAQKIFLALGNPSNASQSDPNNYLLVNNYYVNSYSRDRGIPNWVAWRVTKADMSNLQREDSFRPDDRLPANFPHVTPSDYTGSGYDRGHIAPNADRDGTPDSMASTFLMTNMVPQTGDLNRGPWAKLEGYLRTLVTRGNDVYIYAGAYGDKGRLKKKVTVPTNTWKIAVIVPAGSDPLSAINNNTRIIAVDMPNVKGIKNADWQTYRTTVRDIEQKTGLNLLSTLPKNIQDNLKVKIDTVTD